MMKNYCEKVMGMARITFDSSEGYFNLEGKIDNTSRKLFSLVSMLNEGGCIGLQLHPCEDSGYTCSLFSNTDERIGKEDLEWAFGDCALVNSDESDLCASLFGENRKVYAFSIPEKTDSPQCKSDDYPNKKSLLSEMLEMMHYANAVMRITAVNDGEKGVCLVICLSVPEALPLRMISVLSIAFSNAKIEELRDGKAAPMYSSSCFAKSTAELFRALVEFKSGRKDENEGVETPIECLELSVRSYACLKRAGVDSVEMLMKMSDNELRGIRNLSLKCVSEIKERLRLFFREDELTEETEATDERAEETVDYSALLGELIGLDEVKEQVRRIVAFARMKRDMEKADGRGISIALNMQFTGNPGTAKTTVARILAGILCKEGFISSDVPLEVGRAAIVSRYIGGTAAKVKEIFERAQGRLLFIDEAYSLSDHIKGSYGDEAINTIVQEIENNRRDTVVVFAGYPKEMDEFFRRNPGLKSRVPFKIEFSDYTVDEMADIVKLQAKKLGFSVSPSAVEKVKAICDDVRKNSDFGNGRFCRNLVENAVLSYASRMYSKETVSGRKRFTLSSQDFFIPKADEEKEQYNKIGF